METKKELKEHYENRLAKLRLDIASHKEALDIREKELWKEGKKSYSDLMQDSRYRYSYTEMTAKGNLRTAYEEFVLFLGFIKG